MILLPLILGSLSLSKDLLFKLIEMSFPINWLEKYLKKQFQFENYFY